MVIFMKRSQWKSYKKRLLHNCPYLVTLIITWLFMTAGGIGLCIYRNYNLMEKTDGLTEPVFTVWMDMGNREMDLSDMGIADGSKRRLKNAEGGTGINLDTFKTISEKEAGKNGQNKLDIDRSNSINGRKLPGNGLSEDKPLGKEEIPRGETLYEEYEPIETDSIYYYDVGKTALTTTYAYEKVRESYFEDAVFFGDSRTLGISDYAGFNADFYCENGMTIYKLLDDAGVVNQNTGEKENIPELLTRKQYGKIYIMLGMNELGYRTTEFFGEQYQIVLDQIRAWQPDAIIFILANLHVNREKNNMESEFNNVNINAKNVVAAGLANGKDIFYLDSNPLFTDEEGFLRDEMTFDGVHLYADGHTVWREFLMEHGVK